MSRRQVLLGAGVAGLGLLVGCGPLPGQARPRTPRIGYLASSSLEANADLAEAFRQGLRELGWVEGQNIVIDYRAAGNEPERFQALAAEFVRLPVDLIVVTGTPGALAAKQATSTIPIVTLAAGDPVGTGLAASYARPLGNLTGTTQNSPLLSAKRVELLQEVHPGLSHVAVLSNPSNPANGREWEETQAAAGSLGLQLQLLEVRGGDALQGALDAARRERADGLIVFADTVLNIDPRIAEFAAEARLPAIYAWRSHMARGGLMTYGPEPRELYRRAAYYVDRILKGAKPADLPIEQPREFEFVINLKTAQALGLTIPQHVLIQATEVIQ